MCSEVCGQTKCINYAVGNQLNASVTAKVNLECCVRDGVRELDERRFAWFVDGATVA